MKFLRRKPKEEKPQKSITAGPGTTKSLPGHAKLLGQPETPQTPRTSETPKRLPRGLDHTKVILNFVSKIGSGPIGVPGLKTAAETVIKVIDIAQVSKSWMTTSRFDVGACRELKRINSIAKLSRAMLEN
jgi:hypothetical protein